MTTAVRRISLEEWERKTTLNEEEKHSIQLIQDACRELPLPSHWFADDEPDIGAALPNQSPESNSSNAKPSSPVHATVLSHRLEAVSMRRSRSTTDLLAESNAVKNEAEKRSADYIGSSRPIETLHQFYDWFATKEQDMVKDQDDAYRRQLSLVTYYRDACDDFIQDVRRTADLFNGLFEKHNHVEKQTESLQATCEHLLQDQEQMTRLADYLAKHLVYFNHLEPIAKLLHSPGEDICLRPEFIPMLQTLDECIDFIEQHLEYRDAGIYLLRFRQCLTRSLTLIHMYVVKSLRELADELKKNESTMAVDYVKFTTLGSTLRPLIVQIERRCQGESEYQSLYDDTIYAYIKTRQQLLGTFVGQKIKQLSSTHEDILSFTKQLCAYLNSVVSDEAGLFDKFFQADTNDHLYQFLDKLGGLYGHLSWRIKREKDLAVLTELVELTRIYASPDTGIDDGYARETKYIRAQALFGKLIQSTLELSEQQLAKLSPTLH